MLEQDLLGVVCDSVCFKIQEITFSHRMRILNDLNTFLTISILIGVWFVADTKDEYIMWSSLFDAIPILEDDRMEYVLISHVVLESAFWILVGGLYIFERVGFLEP